MNNKIKRKTIDIPYYELIIDLGDDFISHSLIKNEYSSEKLRSKKVKNKKIRTKNQKVTKKIIKNDNNKQH